MMYEKVALVILFLAALFVAQIFLYRRSKSTPYGLSELTNIKVISRLNLSKTTQLNIITAGSDTLLIVSPKNAPATVMALNVPGEVGAVERQINEV